MRLSETIFSKVENARSLIASEKVRDRQRARRARYPELPDVAVANFGQFLPSQTQPVVPRLTHAVARGEITLIELVAFDDLREHGFN